MKCTGMLGRWLIVLALTAVWACPTDADDLVRARALTDERDFPAALAVYDRLQASDPGNSDLAIERARVLGFADRNVAAAQAYADIVLRFPSRRGDVLEAWSWQRLWSGDAAGAVPMFREQIALRPDDARTRLGLGQSLLWSGHSAEAIGQFDLVLATDPGARDARTGRAYALNFVGRPLDAAREFGALLPSGDAGLSLQAARAYYWAGFPDLALPLLQGTPLPEAQWLRDYRVSRERLPYLSASFDWSDDSDDLRVLAAGAAGGWRLGAGDTVELAVRSAWLDGPDTSAPSSPRDSLDGQQVLLSWSGRRGRLDSEHGVLWPMVAVGVRDYDGWTAFAWRARARYVPVDGVRLTAYAGNGVPETVGAIHNRIGYTEGALSGDVQWSDRWLFAGSVSQLAFDRGNDRNQATLRAEYLAVPSRRLRVGLDGLYFTDSDPTGPGKPDLGYWNPERYAEERLYAFLSGERGAWGFDGRASVGYFEERDGWGTDNSGPTFAIEAAASYDFSPGLQLRLYAGGSSSGASLGGGGEGYHRTYAGVSLTGYF